ncbi:MAG: VOC family protein [Solirubrobacterales bacterium]|nr:VOC family protein [Solirubrobacterales bacterium]
MSSLAGVNHVTVLTSDLDQLSAFYEDVFGARKLVDLPVREPDGPGRHALIGIGGGAVLHLFELRRVALPPARPMFARGRVDHFALHAPDREAFERLRSQLLARGATDGAVTDFGIVRVLTFTDPDGYPVELAHWVGAANPDELDMSHASDDELIARRAAVSPASPPPAPNSLTRQERRSTTARSTGPIATAAAGAPPASFCSSPARTSTAPRRSEPRASHFVAKQTRPGPKHDQT